MSLAYAESNEKLLGMADGEQTDADNALAGGAMEIDFAASAAGYAVPIDTSVIANDELRCRFEAWLETINLWIAAGALSRSATTRRGTPEQVKKDWDEAKERLERVRSGLILFPTEIVRFTSSGMKSIGSEQWPDLDTRYDIQGIMVA